MTRGRPSSIRLQVGAALHEVWRHDLAAIAVGPWPGLPDLPIAAAAGELVTIGDDAQASGHIALGVVQAVQATVDYPDGSTWSGALLEREFAGLMVWGDGVASLLGIDGEFDQADWRDAPSILFLEWPPVTALGVDVDPARAYALFGRCSRRRHL